MKKFIAIAGLALSSTMSFAVEMPNLPVLKDVSFSYYPAPALATVEPTAYIQFKYSSCSKRDFILDTSEKASFAEGDVTYLAVDNNPNQADCFGPLIERDYEIEVNPKTVLADGYIVVNPTRFTLQRSFD